MTSRRTTGSVVFVMTISLLLVMTLHAAGAEKIPLTDGRVLWCDAADVRDDGLLVTREYGKIFLPWSEISRSYKKHPAHQRPRTPPAAVAPEFGTPEITSAPPRAAVTGIAAEASAGDRLAWLLLLGFVFFWLNMFCVWLVSHDNLVGGATMQGWNLAALIVGLPAALVFHLKYRGLPGVLARRKSQKLRPDGSAEPVVCLYTWDGEVVKPGVGKQASSGLTVAQGILCRAVELNASDIHFDTTSDGVNVRFRVDGSLRRPEPLNKESGKRVMAAIKMAAGLDVGKQHDAQDGACHLAVNNAQYDLRIARAWAVNGETLVIRLLKSGAAGDKLTDFGMTADMSRMLGMIIKETAGILILAGPTGSGKTTTIYTLLRQIVGTGRNILTIEDPVEYRLDGATQISLNPKVGSTFASALRASMRHDPDVILVGEIRDSDTLNVAFQAALTGHFVFTTIHASSVLATFGRLRELGISSYMVNTGLKCIVCQRLIRKLCPSCRESYIPEDHELQFWGLTREENSGHLFSRPVGCHLCGETGYHGRTGIYRTLPMSNALRQRFTDSVGVGELQEVIEAEAVGHVTDTARSLLWSGETSPEELQRTLDMFDFGKRLWNQTGGSFAVPDKGATAGNTADET